MGRWRGEVRDGGVSFHQALYPPAQWGLAPANVYRLPAMGPRALFRPGAARSLVVCRRSPFPVSPHLRWGLAPANVYRLPAMGPRAFFRPGGARSLVGFLTFGAVSIYKLKQTGLQIPDDIFTLLGSEPRSDAPVAASATSCAVRVALRPNRQPPPSRAAPHIGVPVPEGYPSSPPECAAKSATEGYLSTMLSALRLTGIWRQRTHIVRQPWDREPSSGRAGRAAWWGFLLSRSLESWLIARLSPRDYGV